MRKLVLMGLTVTVALAIAAVAFAQSSAPAVVTVTGKITPSSGGTKSKPVKAGTEIVFNVNPDSNSTLASIDYGIPSSIQISGKGFPKCSADTINNPNGNGEADCPKGSKVGTGASTALLGPGKQPIQFSVNVYANGKNHLTLALQQVNGQLNIPFDATIANGHISFDIPPNVQQPIQGLYSYVTSVTADLGPASVKKTIIKKVKVKVKIKGKKKKKTVTKKKKIKRTYYLVSRTGCSGGKDDINVSLGLANNPNPPAQTPITGATSIPCS